jgi:serine protease Do
MTSKKTGYILGAVAGAGVLAAAVAGAGMRMPSAHAAMAPGGLIKASTAPIFAPPPGAPMSFADIFERVSPAVVSINVTSRVDPDTLRQIPGFGNLIPRDPRSGPGDEDGDGRTDRGQPKLPTQQSSGSGFFISADGYIVTNNHVVENAKDIKIILKDKRELKAEVVGRDPETDLAVLKAEGSNFPFVNFENSAEPRVGDWVITIGNPFGLGGTATAGIVSAYGRNLEDASSTFVDYLQIDAPINRGNSGGPTFDVYGRVIGVNSAIFSPGPGGGSVGIGFAIPSNVADSVTKQLIAGKRVTRGFLGARVQSFTKEAAESLGIPARGDGGGAYILDVTPGGPADKAGVQAGDVVVSVNGKAIADSTALTRTVAASRTGDNLRLEILRAGKTQIITVRSGTRPTMEELNAEDDEDSESNVNPSPEATQGPTVLGLRLGALDEASRRRYQIAAGVRGVVVESVEQTSTSANKLTRGDVIVMANGVAVATPAEVVAAVEAQKAAKRSSILFHIIRAGSPGLVVVDLEKKP